MKVQLVPITSIRPYDKNPRLNDYAVDAVANSIREFGFRQPIVVDKKGVIIVGHTRYKAALKLGLKEVPVHVARGLTPAQVKAYRIADNQTASLAQWDYDLLPLELADLQKMNVDLDLTGFSSEELLRLLEPSTPEGLTDPDAIPEPPDKPTTQPGDLWVLRNHRLLCGDSSSPQDVNRLLNGAPIHLVNTDPPYGVKLEPRSNNAIAAGLSSFTGAKHDQRFDAERHPEQAKPTSKKMRAKDRPLTNDFLSDEDFTRLLTAWFSNISRALQPGRSFYIWGGYSNLPNYPPALAANGLYFSQAIIWNKLHPVLTRKDFLGCFEVAFYGWKTGAGHQFFGPKNALDLWEVKKIPPTKMEHLTEKPVELASRAIQYSSQRGENVLDLFAGSGSTLIVSQTMTFESCPPLARNFPFGEKQRALTGPRCPFSTATGVEWSGFQIMMSPVSVPPAKNLLSGENSPLQIIDPFPSKVAISL
jgi:DNA modification methylase